MKKLKKLSFITTLICAVIAFQLHAQSSTEDTLQIVTSSATPGDTVAVPINMVNTFSVSGIQLRIGFDPQVLSALEVDTSGTRVSGIYTHFPTQIDNDSGVLLWSGINFTDPFSNYVPPGSGPVAYLIFEVDLNAPGGSPTLLEFEDDTTPPIFVNSLSDRWGNMVFPVFVDGELHFAETQIEERVLDGPQFPEFFCLDRIFPNPFTTTTTIRYGIPSSEYSSVSLKIFNLSGSLVANLLDESQKPGWWILRWNGKNDSGMKAPAGVYFCRMEVNGRSVGLQKIVRLK